MIKGYLAGDWTDYPSYKFNLQSSGFSINGWVCNTLKSSEHISQLPLFSTSYILYLLGLPQIS